MVGSRLAVEGTRRLIEPRGSWNDVCTYDTKEQANTAYQHKRLSDCARDERCNGARQVRVRNRSQVASSAFTSNFSMSQGSPEPQPTNYSPATFLDCDATESFLKKEQKAGV